MCPLQYSGWCSTLLAARGDFRRRKPLKKIFAGNTGTSSFPRVAVRSSRWPSPSFATDHVGRLLRFEHLVFSLQGVALLCHHRELSLGLKTTERSASRHKQQE